MRHSAQTVWVETARRRSGPLVFIGPHASETKGHAAGRSRLSEPSFGPAPNAAAAPTMGAVRPASCADSARRGTQRRRMPLLAQRSF